MKLSALFLAGAAAADAGNSTGTIFSAYFADWAKYHKGVYKHEAADLKPIAGRVDHILHSFTYFCPPAGTSPLPYWAEAPYGSCSDATEFEFMSVDASDAAAVATFDSYKASNPKLKVISSIGGWNFPSEYFSKMVSSKASRTKFIKSAEKWMAKYGFDGIDLDWEYPCSPPRKDPVKIACQQFRNVADAGGSCPADKNNLPLLIKEMRAAFGQGKMITIASQAAEKNWVNMNLKEVSPYLDYWHVMSYDYFVSDVTGSPLTGPNAPLYSTKPGEWSIDYTVKGYIAAGVPKEKIIVGIPFYGHTWYAPDASADWNKFGVTGTKQHKCCGTFGETYGAKFGRASQQCGTLMYSEIMAQAPKNFWDTTTESDIGYWESDTPDAAKGTWVSYNSKKSIDRITAYVQEKGVAGLFIFDTSMDTVTSSGEWTYELMNQIADQIGGHGPAPAPSPPAPGPGPAPGPAPGPIPPGTCRALSPQVTDAWCTTECHATTPFCPSNLCKCA